jgi:hypothetical protein
MAYPRTVEVPPDDTAAQHVAAQVQCSETSAARLKTRDRAGHCGPALCGWGLTRSGVDGLEEFGWWWGVDAAAVGVAHFEGLVFEHAG